MTNLGLHTVKKAQPGACVPGRLAGVLLHSFSRPSLSGSEGLLKGRGRLGGLAEERGWEGELPGLPCMSMRGRHTAQELIAYCHPTACCQEQGRLACNSWLTEGERRLHWRIGSRQVGPTG
eukprot:1149834-Pelagomonas_calceolata.AAC.10